MSPEEEYEAASRYLAETQTEYSTALISEIRKGTESDAALLKIRAEGRMDTDVLDRYFEASERFNLAAAALKVREVRALEAIAESHLRQAAWATDYVR